MENQVLIKSVEHPAPHRKGTFGDLIRFRSGIYALRVGASIVNVPQGWAARVAREIKGKEGKQMTITYQAVREYNQEGHPRRDEILYHFNFHINYREGQPKALRIKEITTTGVIFELDNGKGLYQEWF